MPVLRQGPIKSYTHTNCYNKTHKPEYKLRLSGITAPNT